MELNSDWNYVSFTKKILFLSGYIYSYFAFYPSFKHIYSVEKKYILREITLIYDHNISAYYCQHFLYPLYKQRNRC